MASGSQKIYGDLVGDNQSSITNFAIPTFSSKNDASSYLTREGLFAIASGSLYIKRSGSNPIKILDDIEYSILLQSIASVTNLRVSNYTLFLDVANNSGSVSTLSSSLPTSSYVETTKTVVTDYTVLTTDGTIRTNASASSMSVYLPEASTVLGRIFDIKKVDSTLNTVNIIPSGSQLIDDYNYLTLSIPKSSFTIQSYGTGYDIL